MFRLSNIFDYYVLMSMYVEADNIVRASGWPTRQQDRFLDRLSSNMGDLENGLAETVSNYLTLACSGEARHAYRECAAYISDIDWEASRNAIAHQVVRYDPIQLLTELSTLFNQYKWSSNFGGKSWGHIADFALQFRQHKISAQFFIDHIVDLVHNGGFAFDKSRALEMAELDPDVGQYTLNEFLTLKTFSPNLLDADELPEYAEHCTSATRTLVQTFYRVFRGCEAPGFWQYAAATWPKRAEITWGTEYISELEINYENSERCACCHQYVNENSWICTDIGEVCYECYKAHFWSCNCCGEAKSDTTEHMLVNGEKWCMSCVRDYSVTCALCGEVMHKSAMVTTEDGKQVCTQCYTTKVLTLTEEEIKELGSCMSCPSLIQCKLKKYLPGYTKPEPEVVEFEEVDNGPVTGWWHPDQTDDGDIPF